jgi:hypothetical protein
MSFSIRASGTARSSNGIEVADDIRLQYNHALNDNIDLTTGFSVFFASTGRHSIVGFTSPIWTGDFANVVLDL